jgi:hypothetical protein
VGELIEGFGGSLVPGLPTVPSADLSAATNVELLVMALGSGRAAARHLGVAESTLRGWRNGRNPRGGSQPLAAAARQAATPLELLRDIRNGNRSLSIKGRILTSSDERDRTINPGRTIPQPTMNRILRMWLAAEDDAKVEAALLKAIDSYYAPMAFLRIDDVYWER